MPFPHRKTVLCQKYFTSLYTLNQHICNSYRTRWRNWISTRIWCNNYKTGIILWIWAIHPVQTASTFYTTGRPECGESLKSIWFTRRTEKRLL